MTDFASFRAVIALWPTLKELADDIGEPSTSVSKWNQRDRIPSEFWVSLLATDRARNSGLTAEDLARLAALRATSNEPDPVLAEARS